MTGSSVRVFGAGKVGRAIASRCRELGLDVRIADRPEAADLAGAGEGGLAILALTHGREALELIEQLAGVSAVIDLTTQSSTSAGQVARKAAELSIEYHAGGLTGGAAQLAEGRAVLLLGPPPQRFRTVLHGLGEVIDFDTPEQAARAKLLHNTFLIMQQSMLAYLGRARGDLHAATLLRVLASGTAGRPLEQSSLARDLTSGTPTSSYLTRLVLKDLDEIERDVQGLPPPLRELLRQLQQPLREGDADLPYTQVLKEIFLDATPA